MFFVNAIELFLVRFSFLHREERERDLTFSGTLLELLAKSNKV